MLRIRDTSAFVPNTSMTFKAGICFSFVNIIYLLVVNISIE
jgi:hypothetical protein